jgi:CheY-like chemotaxis protein
VTAGDGPSALAELARRPDIKMIVADIILKGPMSGIELAERALAKAPDLKVLHITGYSAEVLMADGRLRPGVALLRKPFARDALARAIENVVSG